MTRRYPAPAANAGNRALLVAGYAQLLARPLRKIQGHSQRPAPSCQLIGPPKAAPETMPQARAADPAKTSNSNGGSACSQPLAPLKAAALRHLGRERQIQRIHTLGPRVVFELIDELDRHHSLGEDLDRRLARYAALDPEVLRAVGGDRFPRASIRIVEDGS